MKKIIFLLIGICILGAIIFGVWHFLSKKDSDTFKQALSAADSMQITIVDPVQKKAYTKTITHQPEVWLLTGTISTMNASKEECSFEGSVQLFSKGNPLFVEPAKIYFSPECQKIVFPYKGKIYYKRFLVEGINYLQDLSQEIKTGTTL